MTAMVRPFTLDGGLVGGSIDAGGQSGYDCEIVVYEFADQTPRTEQTVPRRLPGSDHGYRARCY